MKRTVRWAAVLISLILVGGCAAPARLSKMSVMVKGPSEGISVGQMRENIGVANVSGGEKTNPFWKTAIGNNEFLGALQDSLKSAALFERTPGEGRFSLNAQLVGVDQPLLASSMTVTIRVMYELVDKTTGVEVYKNTISADSTATLSDSLYGTKRLQIATERSARQNITTLIEEILKLSVSQ